MYIVHNCSINCASKVKREMFYKNVIGNEKNGTRYESVSLKKFKRLIMHEN